MIEFKFCPRCTKPLKKTSDRLIHCDQCGFHIYLSPALANAIIIENKKKEILLVKRKFSPKKNYWDLPGGFIEYNETAEESIIRETREELHIGLTNFRYFKSYIGHYPYRNVDYITLGIVFVLKDFGENIRIDDDVSAYAYFSHSNIPFEKLAFEPIRKALEDYLSSFQKLDRTKRGT